MLGEGLTTAAPVQQLKFDEAAFDRPERGRRRKLLALGASLIAVLAIIIW